MVLSTNSVHFAFDCLDSIRNFSIVHCLAISAVKASSSVVMQGRTRLDPGLQSNTFETEAAIPSETETGAEPEPPPAPRHKPLPRLVRRRKPWLWPAVPAVLQLRCRNTKPVLSQSGALQQSPTAQQYNHTLTSLKLPEKIAKDQKPNMLACLIDFVLSRA